MKQAKVTKGPRTAGRLNETSAYPMPNRKPSSVRGGSEPAVRPPSRPMGLAAVARDRARPVRQSKPRSAGRRNEFPELQSLGDQLRDSLAELEVAAAGPAAGRGPLVTRRAVEVKDPADYDAAAVRAVRRSANVSQSVFALLVGASVELVQAWEQGLRRPNRMASRLLDVIGRDPAAFVGGLYRRDPASPSAGEPSSPPGRATAV